MDEESNEVIVLKPYEVLQDILADLYARYFDATDDDQRQELLKEILQVEDRISKMDEQIVASNKNIMDNETKLQMNENDNKAKVQMNLKDNETKLKINENDNNVRILVVQKETESRERCAAIDAKVEYSKMAVQGASSLLDIARATAEGVGRVGLCGMSMIYDAEGVAGLGRSSTFKLASDLGRSTQRLIK